MSNPTRISLSNLKTLDSIIAALNAVEPAGYGAYESVSVDVTFYPTGYKAEADKREQEYQQRNGVVDAVTRAVRDAQRDTDCAPSNKSPYQF